MRQLDAAEAQPDKSLGQHWLRDAATLKKIVSYASLTNDDTVLEIGAGLGTLTAVLAEQADRVVAVEFDRELAKKLTSKLTSAAPSTTSAGSGVTTPVSMTEPRNDGREGMVRESSGASGSTQKIDIINADFLRFDLNQLPTGYKVVANIPYYITNKIVMKLLTADNKPRVAVLLVQKEVAERLAARPGAMSVLSVAAQLYATVELGEIVPAALFTPPPKVDSQVVILHPRLAGSEPANFPNPRTDLAGSEPAKEHAAGSGLAAWTFLAKEKQIMRVAKAGFSARRKKLRTALAGGLNIPVKRAEELLRAAAIDPNQRAQELSLDEWYNLSQVYENDSTN